MKWQHRIAQGFSPGYGHQWVRPEGAPERDSERSHGPALTQDLKAIDGDVARHQVRTTFRSPFQGDLIYGLNPGLKPWAILFSHFVATGVVATH
jgi:hypothetical protein